MAKIHIVHGSGAYAAMCKHLGHEVVDDWAEADLILFTGGEDVGPSLYGEDKHPLTHSNERRDSAEVALYYGVVACNIPMVGICRGAQFLNVMNGGSMYQHVEGHATGSTHAVHSNMLDEDVFCTSTHHQMMIPTEHAVIEGFARGLSPVKQTMGPDGPVYHHHEVIEAEVLWYEGSKCLCFQPHPEHYGAHSTRDYFEKLLNYFIFKEV